MEQKHLVLVLFALLIASFTTGFHSYRTTEQCVTEDMSQKKIHHTGTGRITTLRMRPIGHVRIKHSLSQKR